MQRPPAVMVGREAQGPIWDSGARGEAAAARHSTHNLFPNNLLREPRNADRLAAIQAPSNSPECSARGSNHTTPAVGFSRCLGGSFRGSMARERGLFSAMSIRYAHWLK